METDQNQNRSAICFPQLEPTQKEGRRSVKPVGKEDTTRGEESAENCEVQVSERMIDMHRKVHMWKASGKLPSTKREPSDVLRSIFARDGMVTQKSTTNTRPLPAYRFLANIGSVQLNILKRLTQQPHRLSTPATMSTVFYRSSTAFQKTLRYRHTIQSRPHVSFQYFMYYTRGTPILIDTPATKLQESVILFPDHQNIWEKAASSTEQ